MRRVLLSASIIVATVAGTLAMTPGPAQAHNNSCHSQLLCPSDSHRYIWYGDAFGPYGSSTYGGATYGGWDPYGYYQYDPAAYYTGYNPYGYYGTDPYGYWGAPNWGANPGYNSWGYGAWGARGWGYGWGGYTGYVPNYSPQWYRYSWNCADAYGARGNEAYVAYWGGREYRCDPAY